MSDAPLSNSEPDTLEAFFQQEEFLAFFDLHQPSSSGQGLTGLCKVARPKGTHSKINYIGLTFIFDTPSPQMHMVAESAMAKLNAASFKKYLPTLHTVTSVPCSARREENYVHQLDLVFNKGAQPEIKDAINQVVFIIRQATGFQTETPQWWDESNAPRPSDVEKANWSSRLKALTRFFIET